MSPPTLRESKAQPVIGMWSALDPPGIAPPVFTPSPFNEVPFALTRLDIAVNNGGNFIVGISDLRGDGRPDYHYHGHFLYADSVSPSRIPVSGAPILVQGIGFAPGFTTTIGTSGASQLATSSTQLTLSASAHGDGGQDLTVSDPVSGASSTISNALVYGAAATDNILLLSGLNPSTPLGVPAANPLIVRVLASDGITPVSGATIGWNASSNVQLSACGGAQACVVSSDQSGYAYTGLMPTAVGVANITATLAPDVYSPSKSVNATLNAIEDSTDIGLLTSWVWISQGATVRRSDHGTSIKQRIAPPQCPGKLQHRDRDRKPQCGQRGDQLRRLRWRYAQCEPNRGGVAGERMRRTVEFTMQPVLCQCGAVGQQAV